MCDQNAVETAEADSRAQDLPLRAFATVDQEADVAEAHYLSAKTPMYRRRRGGCSKECEFEQLKALREVS